MEARTGTGPQLQFQVDKAEPEARAKAVAVEATGCSSHITAQGRLSGAATASSHLPKNPHPSPDAAVLAPPGTSSSSRNNFPVSRPHTVLPVDIGNQ